MALVVVGAVVLVSGVAWWDPRAGLVVSGLLLGLAGLLWDDGEAAP